MRRVSLFGTQQRNVTFHDNRSFALSTYVVVRRHATAFPRTRFTGPCTLVRQQPSIERPSISVAPTYLTDALLRRGQRLLVLEPDEIDACSAFSFLFFFLSFFLPFSSFREREIFIFLFFFSRIFCEFKGSVARCFKGIWVWDKNWTLDFFFFFFFSREGGRFCVDDFFQEFYGINWLVIKISMFDDFESLIGY